VDQFGRVQAIGAVNEKVEGYFDICNQRGLTGSQGVLIPASNVAHLMLRQDVVDAAAAGRFHIYAVATVVAALDLLTGSRAGTPAAAASLDQRVAQRLKHLVELRRKFAKKAEAGAGGSHEQNDE
jgi:predicted ATP-dependent protease